ncbi:Glycopeptide antibiotics resistance protein [Promicromonospora umidemergens]|uniref:VanZ-like domain-containing protein n=1 Tax=Promicromonospora umidemergens TaxID=629679 RepID=A0ABP8X942_9MICO|nr:Glycopeptide antibiotics resistance protein [Promicromonospora umidemergens]
MLLGTGLFLTLLVPVLVIQVRRYGTTSPARLLGAAALAVYGTALAAYTLLPLPSGDVAAWCADYGYSTVQLRPGQTFVDIRERTAGLSLGAAVRDISVLQGVFNVVLFVPWGILVRRYLGWGLLASAASALAASLLIEVTQGTGVFGLIPCSYRLADVDDLITNTAGGVLGAVIAPWVLRWMPRAKTLAATRGVPRPVTVWRRWLGMAVDAVAYTLLSGLLTMAWGLVSYLGTGQVPPDTVPLWLFAGVLPWLVVFVLPLATGAGESLGQRTVWLAVVPSGSRVAGGVGVGLSWAARVRRGLVGGALWGLLQVLSDAATMFDVGALASAAGLASALAAVLVVAAPFTAGKRGLSGKAAPYRLVDARAEAGAAGAAEPPAGSAPAGSPPAGRS